MWNGILLAAETAGEAVGEAVNGNEAQATDVALKLGKDLLHQLATVDFNGVLLCVVLMLAAGYICLEGYGIYKMALSAIGFSVGFSRAHIVVEKLALADETMLMVQAVVGLICGALAVIYVRFGIFMATYHFVQRNLAAALGAALAAKLSLPTFLVPTFSALVGIAVGVGAGYLMAKAERPVVVIVTAVVGGFAAVGFFLQMVPNFPVDMHYIPAADSQIWVIAKLFLSAAGAGVQGLSAGSRTSS